MPEAFTIRIAGPDDSEAACTVLRRSIIELCQSDYEDSPGRLDQWLANKTPKNVRNWIMQESFSLLLADHEGTITGVAGMTGNLIQLNYVNPDWRFKGVSSALLTSMEKRAQQAGAQQTRLESSQTALRFYQSRGYRPDPAASHHDGHWLTKELSSTVLK